MSRAVMGVSTVHQQDEMKRMIRWLPIIAVEIYLLFTLALYICIVAASGAFLF